MGWSRHKLRLTWHKELKNDGVLESYGFTNRLFRQKDVYLYDLIWWDYPHRSNHTRSWKAHRKTQYKAN